MTDCIVIGGGIIGMMTARNLTMAGMSVTLLEKGQTGRESSWAGGGIVSPLYPWRYADSITRLASWGQKHYQEICAELFENTGIDPEYTVSGLLMLAADEESQAVSWAETFNRNLKLVNPESIAEIEPAMQHTQSSGIWMDNIAQVRNPRIVKSLRSDIEKRGVKIIPETEVMGFNTENQRVTAVKTANQHYPADRIAICTGAWTGDLLQKLKVSVPVQPVQGQMILFKAEPETIKRMVLEADRYVIPRRDGRVLFGSTVEHVGFNKQISDKARQELYEIATQRFPVLTNFPVEHHWAGLRPGSPDGVPIISRHPTLENLFVNAGHFRNGVILGPGSCQLAAEMILEEKPSFDPDDYSIDKLSV